MIIILVVKKNEHFFLRQIAYFISERLQVLKFWKSLYSRNKHSFTEKLRNLYIGKIRQSFCERTICSLDLKDLAIFRGERMRNLSKTKISQSFNQRTSCSLNLKDLAIFRGKRMSILLPFPIKYPFLMCTRQKLSSGSSSQTTAQTWDSYTSRD